GDGVGVEQPQRGGQRELALGGPASVEHRATGLRALGDRLVGEVVVPGGQELSECGVEERGLELGASAAARGCGRRLIKRHFVPYRPSVLCSSKIHIVS